MKNWHIEAEREGWNEHAIIDFLSKSFGPDYYAAFNYKTQLFSTEPSHRPDNIVTVKDENHRLLGVLRIVKRDLLIDGIPIKAGFVTSVAVHPDWRGKGIGIALVKDAVDLLANRGCVLAGVHGRRAVDGFYPKFGYHPVGRYINFSVSANFENPLSSGLQIVQYTSQDELAQWYTEQYSPLTGSVFRTADVWRFLLKKIELSRGALRIYDLVDQRKKQGYIAVLDKKVIELAADRSIFERIAPSLASIGITDFSLHPHHPYIAFIRQSYNTVQSERFELKGGYMMKVLNMRSFLENTLSLFSMRARRLPVCIDRIRMLGYELDFKTGSVMKCDGVQDISFENDRSELHALIGFHETHWNMVTPSDRNKEELTTLFPALGFHSSTLDEV